MAQNVTYIDDIVAGTVDYKLKVRIIHMWDVANRNTGEITSIEMLLLDEKVLS